MITSTKGNGPAYAALFADAAKYLYTHDGDRNEVALGSDSALKPAEKDAEGNVLPLDEQPPLTSLDEYFSFIEELARASKVYTILPLNEPPFEIDTNTREISIPEVFKANGVAIQGDEVAEILYFRAPRYFDATDLSLKEIYIQWEAANGKEGVSLPWVVDIDSEPGFIYFGWPLSTQVTKTPGSITFSVRFYSIDETSQKINYSLATEPATITVKPSLDYDLTKLKVDGKVIDDSNDLILNRFKNTTPGNSTANAEVPVYVIDFDEATQKSGEPYLKRDENTGIENTYIDADLDSTVPADPDAGFREVPFDGIVEACSTDGGNITYIGYKFDYDTMDTLTADTAIKMVETKDTVRNENKLYYYLFTDDSGAKSYKIYKGELDQDSLDELFSNVVNSDHKIYEKVFTIKVDSIGYYVVTATNRVRTDSKKKNSIIMRVPRPVSPNIERDLKDDVDETIIVELNKETGYGLDINVVTTVADRGHQTYKWFRQAPGEAEASEIPGATDSRLHIKGYISREGILVEGTNDIDHYEYVIVDENGVAAGDGFYYCEITNHLNGDTDTVVSNTVRITHKATAPKIDVVSNVAYSLRELEAEDVALEIEATVPAGCGELVPGWRLDEDSINYEWYRYYSGDGTTLEEDINKSILGTYVIDHDQSMWAAAQEQIDDAIDKKNKEVYTEEEANELIALWTKRRDDALKPQFDPYEAGYYFCVATNIYNGTSATTLSRFFSVSNA